MIAFDVKPRERRLPDSLATAGSSHLPFSKRSSSAVPLRLVIANAGFAVRFLHAFSRLLHLQGLRYTLSHVETNHVCTYSQNHGAYSFATANWEAEVGMLSWPTPREKSAV